MEVDWSKINNKVPMFSLEDQLIKAKVVSVYDGDTVKVVFPLQGILYRWNCRLTGVDTPELRCRCKLQKAYGYKVRDALREKILNKVLLIKCGEFDKYGRLLAKLYVCQDDCDKDSSVNEWLIENGYAFSYDGGTKECWSEFLKENPEVCTMVVKN